MAIVVASSSPSSSSVMIKNEVFLSFRGDTRKNFTSHLYDALCRKHIQTYIDAENLERGEEMSPALLRAIEESMISIVVFSKEYASSRWCLDELVHILKCKEERGQIVLPIFYGIDPSDIRKQKGSYGAAFVEHEQRLENDKNKLKEWRDALTAAANLSGFHSQEHEYESKLIEKIVEDVFDSFKDYYALPVLDLRLKTSSGRIHTLHISTHHQPWVIHLNDWAVEGEEEAKITSNGISLDHVFIRCWKDYDLTEIWSCVEEYGHAIEAAFDFRYVGFKQYLKVDHCFNLIVKRIGCGLVYKKEGITTLQ